MVRNFRSPKGQRSGNKNTVSNVRIVDKDEGTDDMICQRIIQQLKTSESQIRVSCNYRQEFSPTTTPITGTIDFVDMTGSTDDFASFSAQFREFRVKAIRFDVYDVAASSGVSLNFWSTFHVVNDAVPPIGLEDIVDRPDSRVIPPGTGHTSLAWVAHGIPEMSFASVDSSVNYGGLSYYMSAAASTGVKYSVIAKFIVDFRGRR